MGKDGRVTDYERRRLENIKRNEEMLSALKIYSGINNLSAVSTKRQRAESKSYKRSPGKRAKVETPVILRRSLRTRGVPPDAATACGLGNDFDDKIQMKTTPQSDSYSVRRKLAMEPGPIALGDVYVGDDELGRGLIETISLFSKRTQESESDAVPSDSIDTLEKSEDRTFPKSRRALLGSLDVESLQLMPENIARLVPGRITSVRFFPTVDLQMVVAGNKFGEIGFWNFNGEKEDGNGIYLYHLHPAPISGIIIDPLSICKMYSSCYEGFIRLMDVEKEVFDLIYSSEYAIFSTSLDPRNTTSLYFSEGNGYMSMWDLRAGKSPFSCHLHDNRINTIDFNSQTEGVIATGSTDGTACIWDLRRMNTDKPTPLAAVNHKRAVQSAYFSPTGKYLATTSLDDKVGLTSGANYENTSMLYHFNQTGRWLSTFRGRWGWDDSSVFIGNMKRGVDIISVSGKKTVATLQSDLISAIPCRFDAHPYNKGMLAGATSGGQVYIWTQS